MPRLAPSEPKGSPLALSAEDVNRLLTDRSSDTRVDMTSRIGGAYGERNFNPKERLIAEQIFRLLLRDTELKVRITLAEHVKGSDVIPRDIILSLAKDVEQVSLPVLQFSEVLSDDDLMDLMNAMPEVSRYIAVSQRRKVSTLLSDMLLTKGDETVATTLIGNKGAEISEAGYGRIIENFSGNQVLLQSMSQRPSLPLNTVGKLVTIVSSNFATTLKKKYKLSDDQISTEVDKTRETETLRLIRMAGTPEQADKLIDQLNGYGHLTPSILLSALCQGNFEFFEISLAKLSNIPVANARKLIGDTGDLGFRALYTKSGLPDAMFPAVKLLLSIVRSLDAEGQKSNTNYYANRIVERILQYSEDGNMENLSYIIALVRRVAH